MAHCPNCGTHLRLIDWRPECPKCKVNMVYFKSNERLLAESEAAEIAHAKKQPSIDRAKASFLGSPAAIARLPIALLPIAGLFLPVCKTASGSVNAIGIYKYVAGGDFGALFGNAFSGDFLSLSVVLLLLSIVMILVCIGCSVMSLGKHGKIRNLLLNGFMALCAVGSTVCFALNKTNPGSVGIGAIIYIALLLVLLVYNLILAKKGLKLNKTVCLIGGLPSEEYFSYVEQGKSELFIRTRMVEELTKMQDKVRAEAAAAAEAEFESRVHRNA